MHARLGSDYRHFMHPFVATSALDSLMIHQCMRIAFEENPSEVVRTILGEGGFLHGLYGKRFNCIKLFSWPHAKKSPSRILLQLQTRSA